MRVLTLALGGLLLASGAASAADDAANGRYQAIPLPRLAGSDAERVMILDTRDGQLWQWWEVPAVSGVSKGGSGMTYMGMATPGSAPGETIPIVRFSSPAPAATK